MIKMLMKLYTRITQAHEVAIVMAYLLHLWTFRTWINFWTTNQAETVVDIKGIKLLIRTKNFFTKSADISMVYECIIKDDYGLRHLNADVGFLIDIGAHIGSFSLAAAKKFPKAKILCFEPSPSSYAVLKKNIKLNSFRNIGVYNKAVSSNKGYASFYIDQINSAANSMYASKGFGIKVPSITLERIFKDNSIKKCAFVKMDCEGAEYDILLNTKHKILRKIQSMAIEYHVPQYFGIEDKGYSIKKLIKHLAKSGFKCTLKKTKHYQGFLIAQR